MQRCGNEMQWYLLKLNSICIPGMNMTWTGFNQCECGIAHCYTDTGTSWISLPIPKSQCDYWLDEPLATLAELGSLLLDIEGVNGTTVTLSLPLVWLKIMLQLGNVKCTGITGDFILGFPIFQYYYLAYDMEDNTVTFVDLQLPDDFYEPLPVPEYGGSCSPRPSSGYYHRMPTTSNYLMAAMGVLLLAFQCMF